MVWAFAESMGVDYGQWVLLHQSLRFEDEFPDETALFQNVVFTERVGDEVAPSLARMRERMIAESSFESAVLSEACKESSMSTAYSPNECPARELYP